MTERKAGMFGLILILCVQLLTMLYWADRKTNYYIDELYSMEYAQQFAAAKKTVHFTESELWQDETWIRASELKERLIVNPDESLLTRPLPEVATLMFNGRNYMGLLNIAESIAAPGRISKWPGILMNFGITLLTQLVLYDIMRKLGLSVAGRLMACAMYGFSGICLGLAVYIRFYAWTMLLFVILVWMHLVLWKSVRVRDCLWTIPAAVLLTYLALKNSELIMILAGALFMGFSVGLLLRRRFRVWAVYTLPVLAVSVWYLTSKTILLDIVLHPASYAGSLSASGWTTANVLHATPESVAAMLVWLWTLMERQLFGSPAIAYAFCITVFAMALLAVVRLRRIKQPFSMKLSAESGFVTVLFAAVLVYTFFAALAGLSASRYYSFAVLIWTVLLWYAADRCIKTQKQTETRRKCLIWLMILTVAAGCATGIHRRMDYIYVQESSVLRPLRNRSSYDVVMIYGRNPDWNANKHALYECVNLCGENAKVYPVREDHCEIDPDKAADKLLIWTDRDTDIEPYVSDLKDYTIKFFGKTHASDIYTAIRTPRGQEGGQ